MKISTNLDETGRLSTYHLEDCVDELLSIDKRKPSSRIIKTKSGRKAIAALKMIEDNNNHSWYNELYNRAQNNMNDTALFYRGNKISFKEMFLKADNLAKALVESGVKYGDEIPACISNTPELVYLMLAANKIGAKLNLFGAQFDKKYINEILDGCTKKIFFASDDLFPEISNIVNSKGYENIVVSSLADSLPKNPKECDEYVPELDKYYYFSNNAEKYYGNNIISFDTLMQKGINSNVEVKDISNLDTDFLVTYTSGSTVQGKAKQIIQTNRSLIVMGRFHDPELSGNPRIEGLRGLAHIHPESNTDVITCISDNLMQGWSVALEPEYDKNKALDYVILNKPNYLNLTTSFAIQMAKDYFNKSDPIYKKLPFLFAMFTVGEGTSKGEEKFINSFLRKSKAGSGIKIKGLSLPYTTLSIGGGDCEHGGIYYTLWKKLFEKLNSPRLRKRSLGMNPVPYAHVTAFKPGKDGKYEECNYNEIGLIAANSATSMIGYKNNLAKTKELIIEDNLGREWLSSNVYGYVDELGSVHVLGRYCKVPNYAGRYINNYEIESLICEDTKNVLSCTVTTVEDGNDLIPVVNIEFMPNKANTKEDIINSIISRCKLAFGESFCNIMRFRIFDDNFEFPLSGSGKRNSVALANMGLDNTISLLQNNKKMILK